jgi:tetratricopeptide (TPR) repeat protein
MLGRFANAGLIFALLAAAGCATASHQPTTQPVARAATQPSDPNAYLSLDQITPAVQLAAATQPTTRPSIESLVNYARARDALGRGQRYLAIVALEKAIEVDPNSYDLYFDLGRAYQGTSNADDRSIAAYEHAAAIEPNHLDLQIQLGRQYLNKNDLPNALRHLRLALQTTDYAFDDDNAAVADFFLARALKQAGYDRAALDEYGMLIDRLKTPSMTIKQDPELAYLIDRPELVYVEVGELYEKHQQYAQALDAYQSAAQRDPQNPELQVRIARMLASLGRRDEALSMAAAIVVRDRATPQSLATLQDVCKRLNLPNGAVDALQKLHHDRPDDRAVMFALADMLIDQNRPDDAREVLAGAWVRSPGDVQLVRRLVPIYRQDGKYDDAARVLVVALAHNPDALRNLSPLWGQLLRPGPNGRLRLESLQSMPFPPEVESARQFWVSRLADLDHRDALAKSALQKSIAAVPPFAPAYRAMVNLTWAQPDLSEDQKMAASEVLAKSAAAGGNASLAAEVRGLALLDDKKTMDAAAALSQAMQLGGTSPDLLLSYALASRKPGKDPQFESLMWKLLSDYPLDEDGYAVLFRYYAGNDVGSLNDAMKVLATWLNADPQSVTARVIEANVQSQMGQTADAETGFVQLFTEDPDQPDVLDGMTSFYTQNGRLGELITRLENYRTAHPQDTAVVAHLVQLYAAQKRMADAIRVLDETRTAVANDADLLYAVGQLYAELDQKSASEEVLQQVVQLDPTHAGASNDLGFSWADEGKNLSRAEVLIRVAVNAEPDNQSFLDSLGWVLYKRGKFDEAEKYLEAAIGPAAYPDPVVLDHLGDTLYRLSRTDDAQRQWQRSLKGIGDDEVYRDDLKQLRITLRKKIKQADAKQPVDVAPVVER